MVHGEQHAAVFGLLYSINYNGVKKTTIAANHLTNEKSHDHVKKSMIAANCFKNLILMPNKSQEETRDRVEKSKIAAKRLKNLAGDTQNINESKINLDS